jgi:peroxiredoxin
LVVAIAVVVLDRYAAAERKGRFAAPPSDRNNLAPPDPARWRAAPLQPGSVAPAFTLADARTGERITLDAFRGRPVVLLLSSFGCNVFCGELYRLVRLSEAHKDRVAFLFVAIRDAGHPNPTSPLAALTPAPNATPEERLRLLREALTIHDLPFPTLFDADGEVERAYDAYPKRLVVIGADGRVVYDGGRGALGGPSEWDLEEVEEHIRAALGRRADGAEQR